MPGCYQDDTAHLDRRGLEIARPFPWVVERGAGLAHGYGLRGYQRLVPVIDRETHHALSRRPSVRRKEPTRWLWTITCSGSPKLGCGHDLAV